MAVKVAMVFLLIVALSTGIAYAYLRMTDNQVAREALPVTREFTLDSAAIAGGAKTATILGTIAISGYIPAGSHYTDFNGFPRNLKRTFSTHSY